MAQVSHNGSKTEKMAIGDKLLDTKDVLVVAYHTQRQEGEEVVDVAPMMTFHLSFLFIT